MDIMYQLHKQKLELIHKLCLTMLSEKRFSFYFVPNLKVDFVGVITEIVVGGEYSAKVNDGKIYIDMREIPAEAVLCVYNKVMSYFEETDDVDKEITRVSNLPIEDLVRYINNTVLPDMVDDIDERTSLTIFSMEGDIPWKGIESILGTVGMMHLVVDSFDHGVFSPNDPFFRYAEIDGTKRLISFADSDDVWDEYGDIVSDYIRNSYKK